MSTTPRLTKARQLMLKRFANAAAISDPALDTPLNCDKGRPQTIDEQPELEEHFNNQQQSNGSHSLLRSENDSEDWDSWDPMVEDFASAKNTLALEPNPDPITSYTGQNQPATSRIGNVNICEHFAKYGRCADGEYCDRVHIKPEARERIWNLQKHYETNKNRICMNFTYLSPPDLVPNPNSLLLVSVTSVTSPTNFYMIAPYESMNFAIIDQHELEFYITRVQRSSSAKTKLAAYNSQLKALFDHAYRIDNLNDEIYLSQIVACKVNDGRYFRAMVLDTPKPMFDQFNFKLLLLDLGHEVEVLRESIFDIKAHCLSEPPLAINCRLNIKPVEAAGDGQWSSETLEYFEQKSRAPKYMLAKLIEYSLYDRIFTVDLLTCDQRRLSVTNDMVNRGLARQCEF